MTRALFAINPETGDNERIAEISDKDDAKIGRGQEVGYNFGTVTDINTGKVYKITQANCGADNCNCAIMAELVK